MQRGVAVDQNRLARPKDDDVFALKSDAATRRHEGDGCSVALNYRFQAQTAFSIDHFMRTQSDTEELGQRIARGITGNFNRQTESNFGTTLLEQSKNNRSSFPSLPNPFHHSGSCKNRFVSS